VRFKRNEAEIIDLFLQENPFFDFSSLSRVAILEFIKCPKLELKPVERHRLPNNLAGPKHQEQ
jgi:hypothetical protein